MNAIPRVHSRLQVGLMAVLLALGVMVAPVIGGPLADVGIQHVGATTELGGMNLNNYCNWKYGGHATLLLWPNRNAWGWRCTGPESWGLGISIPPSLTLTGVTYEIWTPDVCVFQYGEGAWSATSNWRDPYSWKCYR